MSDVVPKALQEQWIDWIERTDWIDWSMTEDDATEERLTCTHALTFGPIAGFVQPVAGQVFDKTSASRPPHQAGTRLDTISPKSLDHGKGIGPIVAHDTEAGTTRSHSCEFRGCRSSFTRKSCLDRHVRTIHERNQQYRCPVKGCFRGPSRRMFTRFDKLKAHVLAVHNIDSTVECPYPECFSSSMTWLELTVHERLASQSHRRGSLETEPVSGLVRIAAYRCPVKSCKKQPGISALASHVLEHFTINGAKVTQDDIGQIWKIGLRPVATNSIHGRHFVTTTYRPVEEMCISCPMCPTLCENTTTFKEHVVVAHLVEPAELQHFLAWRSVIVDKLIMWHDFAGSLLPGLVKGMGIVCPRCGWDRQGKLGRNIDHHMSMFRTDLSHLEPYKMEILRLYPGFGTASGWRPLWEYLARPLGGVAAKNANDTAN